MPRLLPTVLSILDLPEPELMAARLDGEVFAVGPGFAVVDEVEGAIHRGMSLASWLPGRVIAERLTAAWVHGARDVPPAPLELCSDSAARYRSVAGGFGRIRQVVHHDGDVVEIGGLRVTAPLRTAVDLARFPSSDDDAAVVGRLLSLAEATIAECDRLLDRQPNLPGKRDARHRLEAALVSTVNPR